MRVGVFGGTFDPPHLGHSSVAAEVMAAAQLDRVLWVPAAAAPHKTGRRRSPAAVRRRMVLAATAGRPGFRLCELELERGGVSYTVDTLRRLAADHPEWSLSLMLGEDLLAGFRTWREAEAVAALADLLVIARPGASGAPAGAGAAGAAPSGTAGPAGAQLAGLRAKIVPATPVDISSSGIRGRIAKGLSVSAMVAPAVLAIIECEGLYRAPPPGLRGADRPGQPERRGARAPRPAAKPAAAGSARTARERQ